MTCFANSARARALNKKLRRLRQARKNLRHTLKYGY